MGRNIALDNCISSRDSNLVAHCNHITSPVSQVSTDGMRATLDYEPHDVLIGIIFHLMLCPGGDKGKVARRQVVILEVHVQALIDNEGTIAGDSINDGIWRSCQLRYLLRNGPSMSIYLPCSLL